MACEGGGDVRAELVQRVGSFADVVAAGGVKEECGHVTAAFTRDAYQHVYPELARVATNKTALIISQERAVA